MTKRTRRRSSRSQGPRVNPYVPYLVFLGLGFGTWRVTQSVRELLLWVGLLIAALLYLEARPIKANFSLQTVGRGGLIGTLLSLPILAVAWDPLRTYAPDLYGSADIQLIFYQLGFAAVLAEELYFRGFAQREAGMPAAIALYAGAALVFFLPNPNLKIEQVLLMVVAFGVLGFVQGYVYRRYGLSAALASRVAINLLVYILPMAVTAATALG